MKPVLDTRGRGLQVGALPWRRDKGVLQVMLVTSRDSGRFVIPKGWPMKALSDPMSAAREAWEEGGVEGVIPRHAIGSYLYEKRLSDGRGLSCQVSVYPLLVT